MLAIILSLYLTVLTSSLPNCQIAIVARLGLLKTSEYHLDTVRYSYTKTIDDNDFPSSGCGVLLYSFL